MFNPDDEVLAAYLAESQEHLADIESDLLTLEQAGDAADEKLVNKVFRAAHSIKGGAGFFGLAKIQELAHKAENVLDMVRSREMTPSPEVINLLLRTFDKLREFINDPAGSQDADIAEYVEGLTALTVVCLPPAERDSQQHLVRLTVPGGVGSIQVSEFDLTHARKSGSQIYLVACDLIRDVQRADRTPRDMFRILEECGTILNCEVDFDAAGTLDDEESGRVPFLLILSSNIEPALIAECVDLSPDKVHLIPAQAQEAVAEVPEPPREEGSENGAGSCTARRCLKGLMLAPDETAREAVSEFPRIDLDHPGDAIALGTLGKMAMGGNGGSHRVEPPPPTQPRAAAARPAQDLSHAEHAAGGNGDEASATDLAAKAADKTLRVNVALLESLMNLAGELVLSRNQLLEAIGRQDQHSIGASGQRINMVASEMQETIMLTRLQPIGNLFQKYPRLVRDLARDLGKEVRLDIEGREVEIDRSILEGLSDPLTHMVRNAVDHGIETPETRVAAGKPGLGSLRLRASHEAGQVVIEIQDDGKGIDAQAVAASAVAKGLLTSDQTRKMSREEMVSLIFLPGLSTAEKVTNVSGRGVGMDVVKSNLDRMGGKVDIETEAGHGSCFRIKLPLTLAIIPSLLVVAERERFAIPQGNVLELTHVPVDQFRERLRRVGDAQVLALRGDLIPIVRLDSILGMPAATDASAHATNRSGTRAQSGLNVVILSAGAFRYGLVVDELQDTVEIVVKPLGRCLRGLREYAGATILGDGNVALILDPSGLATKAGLSSVSREVEESAKREATAERTVAGESQSLLTFFNAANEPCAVSLRRVERIERVQSSQVEYLGGRRTLRHRDGCLPLVTLRDIANVGDLSEEQEWVVILLETGGEPLGLLAAKPVDIVETSANVDNRTLRQPGILGSLTLRDRTTLLVDLDTLAASASGAQMPDVTTSEPQPSLPPRSAVGSPLVLLAEDSGFFRNQVKQLIEGAGYRVLASEDGRRAWESLEEHADEVQLAVLDLEMPEMTGLELTQKMRADNRFARLPVIVLTSLASEEDIAYAKSLGVDDYQIKLDKESLVQSVNQLLVGRNHQPHQLVEALQ